MKNEYYEAITSNPIIAAIKDDKGLEQCITMEDINVVFILYGSIATLSNIVSKIKGSGKIAFVHMDLISGFSAKDDAVDFVSIYTEADGIISTRPDQLRRGKELGLCTVFRIFALDSKSLAKAQSSRYTEYADVIEVLPGLMPKIIKQLSKAIKLPLVAGGLISEKEDVIDALNAGATAISTTNPDVWTV